MRVILLESVRKLGRAGEVVEAKNGFARNFLIPQGKAQAATKRNLEAVEARRTELAAADAQARADAEKLAETLAGRAFTVIAQAGENEQLYGAITPRAAAAAMIAAGVEIDRRLISLPAPVRALGLHAATLMLHPEVSVDVELNVARNEEEAQARLFARDNPEAAAAAAAQAEADEADEAPRFSEEDAKRAIASAIEQALAPAGNGKVAEAGEADEDENGDNAA